MLAILTILPVLILGAIMYFLCRGKAPLKRMTAIFGMGCVCALIIITISIIVAFVQPDSSSDNPSILWNAFDAFFLTAAPEEGLKWAVLLLFAFRLKPFRFSKFECIAYGASVGLGFGCLENIGFALTGDPTTMFLRMLFSVPGHFAYGVIMGYFLWRAYNAEARGVSGFGANIALSLAVPILVHGLYDFLLFTGNGGLIIIAFVYKAAVATWAIVFFYKESRKAPLLKDAEGDACLASNAPANAMPAEQTAAAAPADASAVADAAPVFAASAAPAASSIAPAAAPVFAASATVARVNFCPNCGTSFADGANFCTECGAPRSAG